MLCCEPIAWRVECNAAILHSCEQSFGCFAQCYNIMVMYQCFIPGAGVFAIKFAVNVTNGSRMIICELDL